MAYTVPKLEDYSSSALDKAVQELLTAVRQEADAVGGENEWKAFRDHWMARKNGILTQVNDLWLKAAPGPSKRDVGARVNQLKGEVEQVGPDGADRPPHPQGRAEVPGDDEGRGVVRASACGRGRGQTVRDGTLGPTPRS